MIRNKWIHRLFIISIACMLVGCSKNAKSSNSNGESKLEDISIMLDWYPNAVHSAIYVAQENGFFAEEGLKVDIEMPADTNDPLKLAATGKVDLAISYQTEVLVAKAEDIPIVSVATLVRHSLDGLMYKQASGITRPKDLEGKLVGYPSSSVSEAIIATMVEKDGGDISKVTFADVGWDLMPALSTDRVDAIIGAYINHELVLLNKEGYDVKVTDPSEYGVPDTYELIVVTGEKTLEKRQAAIERFWRAVTKGQEIVKKNPEEGLQVLLDHENDSFPLDKKAEIESLHILLPLMDESDLPFGFQEEASWKSVADWLYEMNIITEQEDTDELVKNIVPKQNNN